MKILLVEDSKVLAPALIGIFKEDGHECVWVKDGLEALAKLRTFIPDIILMDIMLPKISGFEITERIKKDERLWKIPVIVLSTLSSKEYKERALTSGADHFVEKPYDLKEVLKEVYKFLPREKPKR